jgi:hypothetical protein
MSRRWSAGKELRVSGLPLRTRQGDKFPGDLRLDGYIEGAWVPVKMELAFALCDFFAENEDEMRRYRSYWRQNGQRYFMAACVDAIRDGWEPAAAKIERQRAR